MHAMRLQHITLPSMMIALQCWSHGSRPVIALPEPSLLETSMGCTHFYSALHAACMAIRATAQRCFEPPSRLWRRIGCIRGPEFYISIFTL